MKKHIRILLTIIFISVMCICAFLVCTAKKDIRQASTKEIESVYMIGPKLAQEIKEYCIKYNIETVDKLEIRYIGEKRKAELKKKFK